MEKSLEMVSQKYRDEKQPLFLKPWKLNNEQISAFYLSCFPRSEHVKIGLKGATGGHLVQPPAQGTTIPYKTIPVKHLSNLLLKIFQG